jgi:hypothetical protein
VKEDAMTNAKQTRWAPGTCRRAATLAVLALLLAGGPAAAQVAAPPADCDALADRAERLECKFDRFADEGKKTAEALQHPAFQGLLTEPQRASLGGMAARLELEKTRVTGKELRTQAAGRRQACLPRECDPEVFPQCRPVDGDGICEDGEDCLEVIGDGVGDDQQPCTPTTGKGREVCAQICDVGAAEADTGAQDEGALDDLETVYDDLTDSARGLNESLPAAALALEAVRVASDTTDPCLAGASLDRFSYAIRHASRMSVTTARSVADVGERFCDSAKGFFSGGILCTGAEVVVAGLEIWKATVELAEGNADARVTDATLACAAQALSTSADLAEQIKEAGRRLRLIEANQAFIIQLIETAQGQRTGFPTN